MARKPKVAGDAETVKRTVALPGRLYNRFVELAQKDHRDVNSQIIAIMEAFVKERDRAEKESGNSRALPVAA